jgi:hypothetical protein
MVTTSSKVAHLLKMIRESPIIVFLFTIGRTLFRNKKILNHNIHEWITRGLAQPNSIHKPLWTTEKARIPLNKE